MGAAAEGHQAGEGEAAGGDDEGEAESGPRAPPTRPAGGLDQLL